jgi:hypothetical protein
VPRRLPHRRRFERVELEIVWAATETLDVGLQRVLLRELATELAQEVLVRADKNPRDRISRAIISLHTAADLLGESPTLLQYRQLRADFSELQLMSDGAIRRSLGRDSWNECLERALIPASTSTIDFISPGRGEPFSREELVAAIRDYMTHHNEVVPKLTELVAWARDPRTQAMPGRRPLTQSPFGRFGGYPAVLRDAGLLDEIRRSTVGRLIAVTHAYSDDELAAAVREVASSLGHTPRQIEYQEAREAALAVMCTAAPEDRKGVSLLPSVSALKKRWGPWANVILAAGLPPLAPEIHQRLPRRPRYTEDRLREVLREAWVACGDPLTKEAYLEWRQQKLAAAALQGQYLAIPSIYRIETFFGGWKAALAASLPFNAA